MADRAARPLAEELRHLGDELPVLAETGLSWAQENPYDRERYQRVKQIAARVFALADLRGHEEIERSTFVELTHLAPVPVADAAVVDGSNRLLLIRRADDGLWAMPGGAYDMGETPAQGAVREALEETGYLVEPIDLVGVYDSRLCGSRSNLQLFQFVFLCRPVSSSAPTTPHEVTDLGWFDEDELPPLSPGHTVRVPDVFRFLRTRRPFIDLTDPR